MNDFTKQELGIILNGLLWRDSNVLPENRHNGLKLKIQSMINNYCEHDFVATIATNSGALQSECDAIFLCLNCKKIKGQM